MNEICGNVQGFYCFCWLYSNVNQAQQLSWAVHFAYLLIQNNFISKGCPEFDEEVTTDRRRQSS